MITPEHRAHPDGQDGEDRGTHRNQDQCAQPNRFFMPLAFRANETPDK
jgi:hypothetical protein